MKIAYDRGKGKAPTFKIGDKVMLEGKNLKTSQQSKKLGPKRFGPFKVIRKVSDLNYELELPSTIKIHPVFHVSLLTKVPTDTIPGRIQPPPPPIIIEGQEEHIIDRILDTDFKRGKRRYLVKWKGYDDSENTWEPAKSLEDTEALEIFEQKLRHIKLARIKAALKGPCALSGGLCQERPYNNFKTLLHHRGSYPHSISFTRHHSHSFDLR